ncbi:MAG: DUF5702 domain-containing protein [Bacteroides sp.]
MKLFRKNQRGSITVLVVLILVPTIFFNGFLVDLARIKLYSNQAVMTADNYGETVLSYYDNVLKELYGLFAVTQDDDALKALNELDKYVKASFNPESDQIGWEYFKAFQKDSYNGFMPYKNASVQLSYEAVAGANLGNEDVLATQIGDFMKFRIVQALPDDGVSDKILKAVDTVKNINNNADAINKKNDLDDTAGELMELAGEYYDILKRFKEYPAYIDSVQSAFDKVNKDFGDIADSAAYKHYYEYNKNLDEIKAAILRKNSLKDDEELSDTEKKYIKMYDDYQDDSEAREGKLRTKFNDAIDDYKDSWDSDTIDFDSYDKWSDKLTDKAEKIEKKIDTLKQQRDSLQKVLDGGNVSSELKNGMTEELKMLDSLFKDGNSYSADSYKKMASEIASRKTQNTKYKQLAENKESVLRNWRNSYINLTEPSDMPVGNFNKEDWKDPVTGSELYNMLQKCFEEENSNAVKKAKSKKKEANKELENAQKSLSEDEQTQARDIPAQFGMGSDGGAGSFTLIKMIKDAASYFEHGSLAEAGNEMLLKFYVAEYDFGMFSTRVTNVKEKTEAEESGRQAELKKSFTGYEMASDINYLYGAEIEYLYGGHNSSKDNLKEARNKILAFRGVVNYASTYAIKSIDSTIRAISEAAAVINPALGLAVSGALRLAVAGIETAADWSELMKGEGVVLIKTEMDDLSSKNVVMSLVGCEDNGKTSDAFKLDYEQYLMVMLMFMTTSDELVQRTGNLITLNVNTVRQEKGKTGTLDKLEFKASDAVTAVNATCAVHLDFVVMPQGFAKQTVSGDTYAALEEFQKNTYRFTVTRGY